MADLDLGKQIGPLPLGAWIAVVAGGFAVSYYISQVRGPEAEVPEEVLVAEPGVGTGGGQFIYEPPTVVETPPEEEPRVQKRAVYLWTRKGQRGKDFIERVRNIYKTDDFGWGKLQLLNPAVLRILRNGKFTKSRKLRVGTLYDGKYQASF